MRVLLGGVPVEMETQAAMTLISLGHASHVPLEDRISTKPLDPPVKKISTSRAGKRAKPKRKQVNRTPGQRRIETKS